MDRHDRPTLNAAQGNTEVPVPPNKNEESSAYSDCVSPQCTWAFNIRVGPIHLFIMSIVVWIDPYTQFTRNAKTVRKNGIENNRVHMELGPKSHLTADLQT